MKTTDQKTKSKTNAKNVKEDVKRPETPVQDAETQTTGRKDADTAKPEKKIVLVKRSQETILSGLLAHSDTLQKDFADAIKTDLKSIQNVVKMSKDLIKTVKGNPAGFLTIARESLLSIDSVYKTWDAGKHEFNYSLPETPTHKPEEITIKTLDGLYLAAFMDESIGHVKTKKDLTIDSIGNFPPVGTKEPVKKTVKPTVLK